MQRFVHIRNIRRFKALIAAEADPEQRRRLERLLADEEAAVHALEQSKPADPSGEGPSQRARKAGPD